MNLAMLTSRHPSIRMGRRSLVAFAVMAVATLSTQGWAQTSNEPVRLGALLSVTGNPANGLTAQVGYKMAVDEINADIEKNGGYGH